MTKIPSVGSCFSSFAFSGFQSIHVDAGVPQHGFAAKRWTEHVDLELSGAARASVNMILADIGFAGGQGRHELAQVHDLMHRVEFVIPVGGAEEMAAAGAANHFAFAVAGDFEGSVELEQTLPAV